jgi:hypothetical protein
MSSAPSAKLPPLFRWVIWFALFNAVGIYLIILLFVPGDEVTDSLDAMVKNVLLGIGFGGAVVSMAIRQIVKTKTKRVGGVTVAPAWIDQAFIAALALAESPAILGLILGLQGGPFKDYLPLFVISAAAFLLSAPAFFYPRGEES